MKIRFIFILFLSSLCLAMQFSPAAASTRKERRLINKGNDAYKERNFSEAQNIYQEALQENPSSAEARYNLGLSQIRQVSNLADTTSSNVARIDVARKNFQDVAALAKDKPGLAAKANLNLGNIEFKAQDFQKAIDYYKQALRIDPQDDKARKNLRIAQLNLKKQQDQKNQNQNKNQDQKQDQQDKDKDKKDQNQDKNKQDQNKDKQDQNKDRQQDQNLNQQSAERILKAIDNKESATRARVTKGSGKENAASGRNTRRW